MTHIFTGSCFAFIHFNRNNLYRKQRLYSRLVKYNASFVGPKSIMAFLLSKLRFEILEFHNSCDVIKARCVQSLKYYLIDCEEKNHCVDAVTRLNSYRYSVVFWLIFYLFNNNSVVFIFNLE